MYTVMPDLIPKIDAFAERVCHIPEKTLILRAGECVAEAIAARHAPGYALFFCGGGNNGADGYAAALALRERGFRVRAVDVFSRGQRSEGGKEVLADYIAALGEPLTLDEALGGNMQTGTADVTVDAMFGTGFSGEAPEDGRRVARFMNHSSSFRVAVDVPLGVNAATGEVADGALGADLTVVLSFMKTGLLSYPAKQFCGETVLGDIGLAREEIIAAFPAILPLTDDAFVRTHLPARPANSHKGTFGKVLIAAGCRKYRGAAHLAAAGAVRTGAGLVEVCSEKEVADFAGKRLPELLFTDVPPSSAWTEEDITLLCEKAAGANSVLIGPGCGTSEGIFTLISRILLTTGCPVVIDADGINALAAHREETEALFANARRPVLLTPHPMEFSRLSGLSVAAIQSHRIGTATAYAKAHRVYLLLKGAGTVITDGEGVHINETGSSALAKGGSGDVLSGVVASLLAQKTPPLDALRIAAYLHGKAGDDLAAELSEYGVTPSDLPRRIAQEIAAILKK